MISILSFLFHLGVQLRVVQKKRAEPSGTVKKKYKYTNNKLKGFKAQYEEGKQMFARKLETGEWQSSEYKLEFFFDQDINWN